MSDGPLHYIRNLPWRTVDTWLQEFGYRPAPVARTREDILFALIAERGLIRWATELNRHAQRLADRATMSRAPVGRAGVIPR